MPFWILRIKLVLAPSGLNPDPACDNGLPFYSIHHAYSYLHIAFKLYCGASFLVIIFIINQYESLSLN
eukprot:COSAG02_NODE_790_length_17186_cov_791.824603_12_plen_68_part_00